MPLNRASIAQAQAAQGSPATAPAVQQPADPMSQHPQGAAPQPADPMSGHLAGLGPGDRSSSAGAGIEASGENPDPRELEEAIVRAIRTCYDPEIPVNIYDLGLIYEIDIDKDSQVEVKMTLTSPACPVAGILPPEVEYKVSQVPGVKSSKVALVWDPPWTPEMMEEAARLELNLY